jgi:hypothetical protein
MAKHKITALSASLLDQPAQIAAAATESHQGATTPTKPVVQTVKVPRDVYVRLKTVGAQERRSSQDIILSALREYLERFQVA